MRAEAVCVARSTEQVCVCVLSEERAGAESIEVGKCFFSPEPNLKANSLGGGRRRQVGVKANVSPQLSVRPHVHTGRVCVCLPRPFSH